MSLYTELAALTAPFSGRVGLWARSMETGEVVEFGETRDTFPSASVIKLPVLYELFRQAEEGCFRLDDVRLLRDEEKVPGAGVLQDLSPGLPVPIIDLATLMITVSDNTASNMCIDLVGTDGVRTAMAGLGLPGLQLHNLFYKAVPGRPRNQAVPAELGMLMDRIVRHEVLNPPACEQMLGIMKRVQFPFIPRFLPEFIRVGPAPESEPSVTIAAKSGAITGCRHEVAAVWKGGRGYVIAVMTKDCEDPRFHEDNEGQILVGKLAGAVHRFFLGA